MLLTTQEIPCSRGGSHMHSTTNIEISPVSALIATVGEWLDGWVEFGAPRARGRAALRASRLAARQPGPEPRPHIRPRLRRRQLTTAGGPFPVRRRYWTSRADPGTGSPDAGSAGGTDDATRELAARPAARRHRRPGRRRQDRADGPALQADARSLVDRGGHQRHLHPRGRRVPDAQPGAAAGADRRRRDRRLPAHRDPRGRLDQPRRDRRPGAEVPRPRPGADRVRAATT